eukprot:Platyproteum_vivax@DN7623_c1_g1_i3.p1
MSNMPDPTPKMQNFPMPPITAPHRGYIPRESGRRHVGMVRGHHMNRPVMPTPPPMYHVPAPLVEIRNDYCQHFVDTGERPQNFIRDADPKTRFQEFPKLQRLVELKKEVIDCRATPHMCLKADLRTLDLSSLQMKFDVVVVDPPWREYYERAAAMHARPEVIADCEPWTFEEIANLQIHEVAEKPSFIFLWVGETHLEDGRKLLEHWGFRRCEDICWIKSNMQTREKWGNRGSEGAALRRVKEHCLMGIGGHVRRAVDTHVIHANVDTDVIIEEEAADAGSTSKPSELCDIIERFCLCRRRLELFGSDATLRNGWVTIGRNISSSNYNAETYASWFQGDGKYPEINSFIGGRHLGTTEEIEMLRPKTPPKDRPGDTDTTNVPMTEENTETVPVPITFSRRRRREEDDKEFVPRKVTQLPGASTLPADYNFTGQVVKMCSDINSVQFLILKINEGPQFAKAVWSEVANSPQFVFLCMDNAGNHVMRALVKVVGEQERANIVKIISSDLSRILTTQGGVAFLQDLCGAIETSEVAVSFVKAIIQTPIDVVTSPNGCWLLRKAADSAVTCAVLYPCGMVDYLSGKLSKLSRCASGSRALELLMPQIPPEVANGIWMELMSDHSLLNDAYSNFLIQSLIVERTEGRDLLLQAIIRHPDGIAAVCRGVYSSRVVERLIEVADAELLEALVTELGGVPRDQLMGVCMDHAGNFVMKNLVLVTAIRNPQANNMLREILGPLMSDLSQNEYGRHVVDALTGRSRPYVMKR